MKQNYKRIKNIDMKSQFSRVTVTSGFLYGFVLIWLKSSAFSITGRKKKTKLIFCSNKPQRIAAQRYSLLFRRNISTRPLARSSFASICSSSGQ